MGCKEAECFNTQPPEGGWLTGLPFAASCRCFNTQPPEGGWPYRYHGNGDVFKVSTHSRLKAAGHT